MAKIESVESLISEFKSATDKDRVKILKQIDINPSEFEKFSTWKEAGYTRNCLARTPEFEFILLCWDANAETAIHDHGGQDCWVYQISGKVEEIRYDDCPKERVKTAMKTVLFSGKLTYMNDKMGYHKLKNISENNERAMTLHIYASPIDKCNVLNSETRDFKTVQMSYDSVVEEVINN